MSEVRDIHILMIEDSTDDVQLLQRKLKSRGWVIRWTVFSSGEEGLEFLETATIRPEEIKLPHLIFLDLNLPGMDGISMLKKIKSHPKWGAIPVIVVTGSEEKESIREIYKSGASCYLCKKPDQLDALMEALTRLKIAGTLN